MKRFFSAFSAFIMVFLLCAAAVPASAEDITINVYNWGEYISDGSEDSLDVNAEFTKATGIKVNYSTYASNEDLYAKLKSGATGYDVIIPSDYMIKRLADENMLEELNYENIPNYQYVYDDFKGLYYDPEEKYTAPYTYGIIGVIYNSARVDEEDVADKSWNLLWNEKYSKMILQFNNSRDAFGTAMYLEGINVNTTDEALWRQALTKLAEQKPIVQSYVMDEIYNKMESGEAWISSYYVGDYLSMYENNEDLAFYFPKEGTNYFVDAMCIPKGSRNKEAAEAYINFMLSKEIAIANAEYIYYASPNSLVVEDPEYADYMGEEAMELLYPDIDFAAEYDKNCYKTLPTETLSLVNNLWEELKIDGSVDAWIYISCIVIIVGFLGIGIYNFAIKKYRDNY